MSPRAASPRVFRQMATGSPMALPNRPVAGSMWPQPLAVPPRLSPRTSIGHRRTCGRPTADTCCSGDSANATRRPRTTSTGMSRRSQAGRPCRPGARSVLQRERFQAFQGLPFPDAWVRAGNRILFHGSVGDSSNMWQVAISPETWRAQRRAAASDVRHDQTKPQPRSPRTGGWCSSAGRWERTSGACRSTRIGGKWRVRCSASRRMPRMTTTRRWRTTGQRWCSVRGERGASAWS